MKTPSAFNKIQRLIRLSQPFYKRIGLSQPFTKGQRLLRILQPLCKSAEVVKALQTYFIKVKRFFKALPTYFYKSVKVIKTFPVILKQYRDCQDSPIYFMKVKRQFRLPQSFIKAYILLRLSQRVFVRLYQAFLVKCKGCYDSPNQFIKVQMFIRPSWPFIKVKRCEGKTLTTFFLQV